jgi:hypothetical protein
MTELSMMTTRSRRLVGRYRFFTAIAAGVFLSACGTEPRPDDEDTLLEGSWPFLEPTLVIGSEGGCERSVPYALLSMNELSNVNDPGGFSISVNVYNDCRNAGGEFTSFEVYHYGTYTQQEMLLSFTPIGESAPLFTGMIAGEYIRLTLPPSAGVASTEVVLLVGPRQPFF